MGVLIEREKVFSDWQSMPSGASVISLVVAIQRAPAVDAVPVVRCKDCRMFVDNKEAFVTYCRRSLKNITVNPDDFCSYGERRTDNG